MLASEEVIVVIVVVALHAIRFRSHLPAAEPSKIPLAEFFAKNLWVGELFSLIVASVFSVRAASMEPRKKIEVSEVMGNHRWGVATSATQFPVAALMTTPNLLKRPVDLE